MKLKHIDGGKEFDFGRTSADYSAYRDIYPQSVYEKLFNSGIGRKGQKNLDLGTGTGVVPRNMTQYGAQWYGIDIAENQIREAVRLSKENKQNIEYKTCAAENTEFDENYFDAVTAVQCFLYFDKQKVLPSIKKILKKDGVFAVVWMAWVTELSPIAQETEELILKHNPEWKGYGYKRQESEIPEWSKEYFSCIGIENYMEDIPFTQESWAGRIRSCRGVAASLDEEHAELFDREHKKLLSSLKEDYFTIPHQILMHFFKLI